MSTFNERVKGERGNCLLVIVIILLVLIAFKVGAC